MRARPIHDRKPLDPSARLGPNVVALWTIDPRFRPPPVPARPAGRPSAWRSRLADRLWALLTPPRRAARLDGLSNHLRRDIGLGPVPPRHGRPPPWPGAAF